MSDLTPRISLRLITQARSKSELLWPASLNSKDYVAYSENELFLSTGLPGRSALNRAIRDLRPNLFHSHGVWLPFNHWCSIKAVKLGVPLIIQPRGMLEPWSLGVAALKKKIALALYQRKDLELASLLVATAEQEAENLRNLGFTQPIATIPNGVKFPRASLSQNKNMRKFGQRHALFLSRIHSKKGLPNLLQAWSEADPKNWTLQLAGPDEGGHLAEVLALSKKLGISHQVEYIGDFDDESKWDVYRNADLFVLPTFSENFGIVVAEALAVGLPVITTTGAPWRDLHKYDCGWWVPPTVDGLKNALRDAFSSSPQRLIDMGGRGKVYVQRYNWADIAAEMARVYMWMLGGGDKPSCVRLD